MARQGLGAANLSRVMTAPLFSIIVPTFNVAATLGACFDSIADQTCSDLEVVMVDGGSTDGTLDIANSYVSRFGTRLIIHSGPDKGVYDAMNRGVSMATGSWLIFLGADDTLYEANTLAQVGTFLDEHDHSDLVYGDVIMRSRGSRYAGAYDIDRLLFEQNICHQAILYRRELFARIGPFNLRYPIWADWDFNIRCFSNPALVIRYMDIVVAQFNELTGVSRGGDKVFKTHVPAHIRASSLETLKRRLVRRTRNLARRRSRGVRRRLHDH